MANYLVNVYQNELRQQVVARVTYNENLDYWDGQNWSNGGQGKHKGITRLRDGRYVIIIGTQWQGSKDYAYIASEEEALQEILDSNNVELLEKKNFKRLKEMAEKFDNAEEIDEDMDLSAL